MILNTRSRQIVQRDFTIGSHQSWISGRYPIPRNWLVGEWILNWDALDSSGYWNNGTATNVTYASTDIWYQAQASVHNWSTSKIACWNILDETGANPFSLSCWVKFTSLWSQMIYWKQLNSWSFWWFMLWQQRLTAPTRDFISMSLVSNDSTFGQANKSTTFNWITTWVWYHIVWTYDWSKTAAWIKIFINTVEWYDAWSTIDTLWTKSISTSADFWIGSRNSWNLPTNWNIQLCRKYDHILSTKEIQSLYMEWLKLLH